MDVEMALRWVRDNIENFGGDPERVTLSGQSSGSVLAQLLLQKADEDETKRLFERVILQSGVADNPWATNSKQTSVESSASLSSLLGCDHGSKYGAVVHEMECLGNKSMEEILTMTEHVEMYGKEFRLTVDGYDEDTVGRSVAIPESVLNHSDAARMNATTTIATSSMAENPDPLTVNGAKRSSSERKIEVLVGSNADEGSLLMAMSRWPFFCCGTRSDDDLNLDTFKKVVRSFLGDLSYCSSSWLIESNYHSGTVKGVIRFLTDYFYQCDVMKTAADLKVNNGHHVYTYLFDANFEFASKAFPYLGAGNSLEQLAIWGRPFVKPDLYTKGEIQLSGTAFYFWKEFVHGKMNETYLGWGGMKEGQAFLLSKEEDDNGRIVEYKNKNCQWLKCLRDGQAGNQGPIQPGRREWCSLVMMTAGAGAASMSLVKPFTLILVLVSAIMSGRQS